MDFRSALREALDEALAADDRVIFFGEDVAVAGGVFAVTPGLYEKYGAERVFDTPISELALAGAAFGSAVTGLRPVVEIMFGDFLPLVMDSVVNQMSKYWFLTRGEVSVPVVIRSVVGAGGPLRRDPLADAGVVVHGHARGSRSSRPRRPATRRRSCARRSTTTTPCCSSSTSGCTGSRARWAASRVAIGQAAVVREGRDVTLVSAMRGVHECLAAAETLAESGHRRRGDRPAHAPAARRRHDPRVAREDEPRSSWSRRAR